MAARMANCLYEYMRANKYKTKKEILNLVSLLDSVLLLLAN